MSAEDQRLVLALLAAASIAAPVFVGVALFLTVMGVTS